MLTLTTNKKESNIFEEMKKSLTCRIFKNDTANCFTLIIRGATYENRSLSYLVKVALENNYRYVICFNMKSSIPLSAIDHLETNDDYVYFVQVVEKYYS